MVRKIAARLRPVTQDADFEAKTIMESVFGKDYRLKELKGELFPTEAQLAKADEMVKRRLSGEPLQYIIGEWEFYGLTFKVGPGALIPRQDTETLVETALKLLKDVPCPKVLDLCSGTGCVAVAISQLLPDASVSALEFSPKAYEILESNIVRYGRVEPVFADALDPQTAQNFEALDLITVNPPYLTKEDMGALQKEVRFEPQMALFGGDDGLLFYRELPKLWRMCLKDGGHLAVEIGLGQEDDVKKLFEQSGFTEIEFICDLTGRVRVVTGKNKSVQTDC